MLNMLIERVHSTFGLVCLVLSLLIPYGSYKLSDYLHKLGDPPWKKTE